MQYLPAGMAARRLRTEAGDAYTKQFLQPARFPGGLDDVVQAAEQLGIALRSLEMLSDEHSSGGLATLAGPPTEEHERLLQVQYPVACSHGALFPCSSTHMMPACVPAAARCSSVLRGRGEYGRRVGRPPARPKRRVQTPRHGAFHAAAARRFATWRVSTLLVVAWPRLSSLVESDLGD